MTYWPNWTGQAMRRTVPVASLCLLTACGGLTVSGAAIDPPPPSLVQPCREAVALPQGVMVQADVERFWRADRARLAECRDKQAGLADWAGRVVGALGE